jgi:hypothetical protein
MALIDFPSPQKAKELTEFFNSTEGTNHLNSAYNHIFMAIIQGKYSCEYGPAPYELKEALEALGFKFLQTEIKDYYRISWDVSEKNKGL